MNMNKIAIVFALFSSPIYAEDHDAGKPEDSNIIALNAQQISDAKIDTHISSSQNLKISIPLPAKVVLNEYKQALVVAKAPGIVAKIKKNIGDYVYKGESLGVIESKEMAEAKTAYITALKRQDLAEQTLASEESLKDKKISSEQDYKRTALSAKEAQINLEMALQHLHILGVSEEDISKLDQDDLKNLCCYEVKAPMDGNIIAKDISLGARVSADQEIYKIADLETVWVEIGVYPKDLARIKMGNKMVIQSKSSNTVGEAVITQLSPVIDEHSGTAIAYALLANKEKKWFPGTFVKAVVIVEEVQVPVAVLKEAVHEIEGEQYVFIVHPDGFEKRKVDTGRSDGKFLEIVSGLDKDIAYASTNTFILKAEHGKNDAEL